jgi:hypothetical protein
MEGDLKVSTRSKSWGSSKSIRSPTSARAKATITRRGCFFGSRRIVAEKRAIEVVWGNRLRPDDYKYIGGFPHFVADAGDKTCRALARRENRSGARLRRDRVYAETWKDGAPARLTDVAVFCDSDDTHTASISYFAHVRLERR